MHPIHERFFSLSAEGLCVVGFDGCIKELNPAWTRLLGYTADEMLGRPLIEFVHPEDQKAAQRTLVNQIEEGHGVATFEYRSCCRDGSYKWLLWNSTSDAECGLVYGVARDITQRKQNEEALLRSHALLEAIRHSQSLFFKNTDPQEVFEDLLSRFLALTGSSHGFIGEALARADGTRYLNLQVMLHPCATGDKRDELYRQLDDLFYAVMRTRAPVIMEAPQLSGKLLNTVIGMPLFVGDEMVGMVGLADRTGGYGEDLATYLQPLVSTCAHLVIAYRNERQKQEAERALRASEARMRTLLDTVADGILTIDSRGRVETLNAAAERIFGYPAKNLAGQPVSRIIPRCEELVTAGARALGKARETIGCRRNGTEFPLDLAITELFEEGERKFTGVVRNITERRRAEQRLHNTMALLRAIVDSANYSIISTDHQGVIVTFNRAAQRWLGYGEAEVIGKLTPIVIHDMREVERRAAYLSAELGYTVAPGLEVFAAKARRGVPDENEWTYVRKDGSRFPVLLSVTALRNEAGEITGFMGVASDITERKKIDRIKSEFISTVSHELRTPLTSIRGSLGLLAGGVAGELPPAVRTLIDIACNNSDRLVRLINDILDIEKIESGRMDFRMRPLDVPEFIRQAIHDNQAYAAQHGVEIELARDVAGLRILADPDRLMQVMANLLSNAVKFSPSGSNVTVAVDHEGNYARIAVTDQGPGIPEEFRSRIFDKFAQADSSDSRQKGGTGLGLSISKAIIEHMGGEISFTSQTGVSTTFFFWLPAAPASDAEASGTDARDGANRILVCEDDAEVGELLASLLEDEGYQVDVANNASGAKELLSAHTYRAMTLDIILPDQDGVSFIRELRAEDRWRNLPILVISAQADASRTALNGGAIGVVDWLDKPVNAERLIDGVRRALPPADARKRRILHVEDDLDVCHVVSAILSDAADVDHAASVTDAISMIAKHHYDLVILDLELQDENGSKLLPFIRQHYGSVPVVVFSAHDVDRMTAGQVASVMIKSRTTNDEFVAAISELISAEPESGSD